MSSSHHSMNEGSDTPLCERCAKIDMKVLLHGEEHQASTLRLGEAAERRNKTYWSFGTANPELFVPWCALCQFFTALSPRRDLGPRVPNHTVAVIDAGEENIGQFFSDGRLVPLSSGQRFVARECVTQSGKSYTLGDAFCVVGSPKFPGHTGEGFMTGRLIKPDHIDYSVISSWIGHCKKVHEECVGPPFMPLKVIDCKRRNIIRTVKHCAYVALSYVWGSSSSSEEPMVNDQLPTKLPATVEDAITVTLALGYDYLWVDRYCIDQNGGEEKIKEISRMDEIYQGAEIVIVDAAGDDPILGLPGVSRHRSITQPHVTTSTHTFVSVMSYPLNHILESKWVTRGWTYQEGALARRRLFFTNQQVYFECRLYGCMETLCQPLPHHPAQIPSIRVTGFMPDVVYAGTIIISHYLKEYSTRQLSFASDTLNAFRGILHMSERQSPPVLHCGGVPLLNNDMDCGVSTSMANLLGFLRGLCWMAPWAEAIRQPGFPSWSWTGWRCPGGGVDFHQLNFNIRCSLSHLAVCCDDRSIKDPIAYSPHVEAATSFDLTGLSLSDSPSPGVLYMTGNVLKFTFRDLSKSENLCLGSKTDNIRFEHQKGPSRSTGKCPKPAICNLYNAGIPKGTQRLTAIDFARRVDPNLTGDSAPPRDGGSTHETQSNSPWGFFVVLLVLKEAQDVSTQFAPRTVFERVGVIVLNFASIRDFQESDWYLEAVEQDIVIV